MIRISRLQALALALTTAMPAVAAEYEKSGDWIYYSNAYALEGEVIRSACMVETRSPNGTELVVRLEPATGVFSATMKLSNDGWSLGSDSPQLELRAGVGRWALQGEAEGAALDVSWTGDAALPVLLESLAASSAAILVSPDGNQLAQFSLRGSRKAIEAMKSCAEAQIGQGLEDVLASAETEATR